MTDSVFNTRENAGERFGPALLVANGVVLGAVAALRSCRRAVFTALWQRVVYLAMAAYLLIGIVLHLRTLATWDTGYVLAFPAWYPLAAMSLMLALIVFVLNQRFAPRDRDG